MEYLVDPDELEDNDVYHDQPLEIDPGLLVRKNHLSWLFGLINSICISEKSDVLKLDSLQFCVNCNRYMTHEESAATHIHTNGPHHFIVLMRVPSKDHSMPNKYNYYVSVQALSEMQVPIGDVLSHFLPHPRADGSAGDCKSRSLYVHPQRSRAMWHGDAYSGRCAYRECEKVFHNKQCHLKLYGITPQFCSISCKLNTWLCCNRTAP